MKVDVISSHFMLCEKPATVTTQYQTRSLIITASLEIMLLDSFLFYPFGVVSNKGKNALLLIQLRTSDPDK